MKHPHLVLALGALVLVQAVASAQTPTVRDSAGIRIVTNPALTQARETFVFQPKPIYDVGGLEANPDLEFKSNQGYLRGVFLSNGTLVVTDETRLQFFDAQAKRLGTLGRGGAGPEEFGYIVGICRTRGDTIVTFDSRNARTAVVSPERAVVYTFPADPNGTLTFSSCFDDGTLVLLQSAYNRETRLRSNEYVRARLDGPMLNPLVSPPAEAFDMLTGSAHAVATAGQRFYHGMPNGSEITVYNPSGKAVMIVRYPGPRERITDEDALARMPYVLPAGGNKPTDAEVAASKAEGLKRWKSGPHAEYWPTHGRIHVDDRGRLWVNQYRKNSKLPDTWVAFAADGRMLGKLVLPEGRKEVIGFGDDTVLIRTSDDDGAAHLSVHSIVGRR